MLCTVGSRANMFLERALLLLIFSLFFLLCTIGMKKEVSQGRSPAMKETTSSSSSSTFRRPHHRGLLDHDPLECKLVKSANGNTFFIMHGEKHQIDDDATMKALFFDSADIYKQNLSEEEIRKYRLGKSLNADWRMMNDKDFYTWANKVHHCTTLENHKSETSERKALLVMVDNRPLDPHEGIQNASYFPSNAVINFQYAKRHNYDFVIFRINSTDLVKDVDQDYHETMQEIQMKYNASDVYSVENYTKNRLTLYNPAIKEFR